MLSLAVLLAIASSLFQTPRLAYIDGDVLMALLSLMLVVAGLKSVRFLDWLARKLLSRCQSRRQIAAALTAVTYVSSMFVTNDVALITFVPLAIIIGRTVKMDMSRTIIIQTLAANLGSMATPPGNPQNLFLFSFFHYDTLKFFRVMLPATALAVILLFILLWRTPPRRISLRLADPAPPVWRDTLLYMFLLGLNIAAVLRYVDKFPALALTAAAVLLTRPLLFRLVDYSLLITFVGFFIFIGNIGHTDMVNYLRTAVLSSAAGTYAAGVALSQIVSNVPAAMLLAGITDAAFADALLVGVNVGGLGTLIASMASVISFKLYVVEYPTQAGNYLRLFTYYNVIGLVLVGIPVYFLL